MVCGHPGEKVQMYFLAGIAIGLEGLLLFAVTYLPSRTIQTIDFLYRIPSTLWSYMSAFLTFSSKDVVKAFEINRAH